MFFAITLLIIISIIWGIVYFIKKIFMETKENQQTSILSSPSSQSRSFTERHSTTIKVIVVGMLTLLLLIPLGMIRGLIHERQQTQRSAMNEITSKWSGEQIVTGPCIVIPYVQEISINNKMEMVKKNLLLFPKMLNINGNISVEKRKRGIYDASVYKSNMIFSGEFNMLEIQKSGVKPEEIKLSEARVIMGISDLKGIRDGVSIEIGTKKLNVEPGIPVENIATEMRSKGVYIPEEEKQVSAPEVTKGIFHSGLNANLDSVIIDDTMPDKLPFKLTLNLNGSQGLFISPIGKTTNVKLTSDWATPSFGGEFLPETREITDDGFSASWKVLDLNRSFGQTVQADNASAINQISEAVFGIKFIQAVNQYQQNLRSVKYAVLIILLTFVVVFFIELIKKKSVNPFQYLLVGLALVLFYSLLLSMSEVWGFNLAYVVASAMTTLLITLHMSGILKNRRQGILIGALLAFLYLFVFILIQMESFALLVGSLGLFAILAIIMYYSKKIRFL